MLFGRYFLLAGFSAIVVADSMTNDISECCVEKDVDSSCLPICTTEINPMLLMSTINQPQCFEHLPDILNCAFGENDYTDCCAAEGLPVHCQSVCSGDIKIEHLGCIGHLQTVIKCVASGRDSMDSEEPEEEHSDEDGNDLQECTLAGIQGCAMSFMMKYGGVLMGLSQGGLHASLMKDIDLDQICQEVPSLLSCLTDLDGCQETILDSIQGIEHAIGFICDSGRQEFENIKECAMSTDQLDDRMRQCKDDLHSTTMTDEQIDIIMSGDTDGLMTHKEEVCRMISEMSDCMTAVLSEACGEEAGDWLRSLLTNTLEPVQNRMQCREADDDDAQPEIASSNESDDVVVNDDAQHHLASSSESDTLVNDCPKFRCKKKCKFGYKTNNKGCEKCKCKPDPCKKHKCASDEKCELQEVQCLVAPCNSVPTCVTVVSDCPERSCKKTCKHGYKKKNGCETCRCKKKPR